MSSIRERATAAKRDSERVYVPAWEAEVEVRSLSVGRAAELRAAAEGDDERLGMLALLEAIYDPETGERAFTDADAAVLDQQSIGVVKTLTEVLTRVSGMSGDALESGKDGS